MSNTRLAAILAASAALALSGAAAATETHCEGHEANLKVVQNMTDELFIPRDITKASKYYPPEVLSHNADGGGGTATKVPIADMQKMWTNSKATYPDRNMVNDIIVCNGDMVVVRVTMTGTMKGPIGPMAPTGKKFTTTATDIYRIKDGKVVERWGNNDTITQLKQLGLLGAVAAAEEAKK